MAAHRVPEAHDPGPSPSREEAAVLARRARRRALSVRPGPGAPPRAGGGPRAGHVRRGPPVARAVRRGLLGADLAAGDPQAQDHRSLPARWPRRRHGRARPDGGRDPIRDGFFGANRLWKRRRPRGRRPTGDLEDREFREVLDGCLGRLPRRWPRCSSSASSRGSRWRTLRGELDLSAGQHPRPAAPRPAAPRASASSVDGSPCRDDRRGGRHEPAHRPPYRSSPCGARRPRSWPRTSWTSRSPASSAWPSGGTCWPAPRAGEFRRQIRLIRAAIRLRDRPDDGPRPDDALSPEAPPADRPRPRRGRARSAMMAGPIRSGQKREGTTDPRHEGRTARASPFSAGWSPAAGADDGWACSTATPPGRAASA